MRRASYLRFFTFVVVDVKDYDLVRLATNMTPFTKVSKWKVDMS